MPFVSHRKDQPHRLIATLSPQALFIHQPTTSPPPISQLTPRTAHNHLPTLFPCPTPLELNGLLFAGTMLGSPAHRWQEVAPGTWRQSRDPMVSGNGLFIVVPATNDTHANTCKWLNTHFPTHSSRSVLWTQPYFRVNHLLTSAGTDLARPPPKHTCNHKISRVATNCDTHANTCKWLNTHFPTHSSRSRKLA